MGCGAWHKFMFAVVCLFIGHSNPLIEYFPMRPRVFGIDGTSHLALPFPSASVWKCRRCGKIMKMGRLLKT